MADHLIRGDGSHVWNLHLRRPLNDWEVPQVASLIELLEEVPMTAADMVDSRWWEGASNGCYSVRK